MRYLAGNRSGRARALLVAWLVVAGAMAASVAAAPPGPVDFAHDIVPLIRQRCAKCHTDGTYKGAFSLDTREAILSDEDGVVEPGNGEESWLVELITTDDPTIRMPPKGDRLTAREVGLVKAWIDQGLPWQAGFSFKRDTSTYVAPLKPRRPPLPPAREGCAHPIDRIVDAYYTRHGVTAPRPLDDVAFLRRLSLDVIGLLPAPEDRDAFLNDPAPDRRDRLIRRVLDDRRAYADHWLSFWNDLLRNDYKGTGYIDGGRKQITGWLYRALLENMPYDRFVRELISPSPESEGFINGIKWRGRVNASQAREVQFSQNVSQVFFGINMKCASCHDSFIDRWKLDEAYGLAAVVADGPLEIYRCDKATGKKATPRFLWPELGAIDPSRPRAERLEQLSRLVTHPDNGRFARTIVNRLWQRLMGRGIVHPVDVMGNRPWSEDLIDYLATYLVDHDYDLKRLIEHVVSSRTYQSLPVAREEEGPAEDYVFAGPEVKRMTAEQFLDAVWMITGAGPARPAKPFEAIAGPEARSPEHRFVRAAAVNADELMRSLGRPNREQVVTTRSDVLTTLEALDLANGQALADAVARGAANLIGGDREAGAGPLVESIYLGALCRRPTDAERAAALAIVGAPTSPEGVSDLLWAVFMLPEFQLIR
jgi:mono/diheme cytochrome c family protein